ncbi:unnamed protein product [Prunus armeniaca]
MDRSHSHFASGLFNVKRRYLQALLKKGPMPTPFDIDVRYLRMETEGLLDKIVPAVVSYLKGLCNLRTLHIKANIFPVDSETEVKKVNKMRLAEYIEAMSGVKVSLDAMFDVQTKRIREYKKGSCLIYLALSIDMTVSSISAEKLEDILVLVHLDLHNCVKIFAQNLKYLKLSGDDIWIGQSLGKPTSLEKADLFLESIRRCFKILSEVLYSINKVETLALNRETTMAIFNFMPLLLENVCYLSIHVGSFRDMLVPGMEGTAVEATIYVFASASTQDIIWRFKEVRSNFDELPEKSIWVGIKRGTLLATALRAYAADPDLQQEWMMVKKVNKMRLAEYIEAMSGVMVCLDAMFDVHTKQIHEYKKGSCLIYLALSINMTVSSSINKVETLALNREITMVIFFPSMAIGAVFYGDFIPLLLENVCYLSIHVGSVRDMLLENALLKKGPMPTPFDIDVRYLRMEIEGLLGKIVPAVVSYLKGLRNLRTLHIKANIFPVDSETEVKKVNKMRLAEYIEAMSGVKVSLHAMFDVQTKRIREYQKGSCLIYLALSIDMTVSRKNYLIPSKGSHHRPPALCTPSSSSCHGDLRSWTP